MDIVKDPQFGDILDYQRLREGMMDVLGQRLSHI